MCNILLDEQVRLRKIRVVMLLLLTLSVAYRIEFLIYIISFSKQLLTFLKGTSTDKSSQFLFAENTSPSPLKNNITGYRILGWCYFFLSTLNISFHSLLACV